MFEEILKNSTKNVEDYPEIKRNYIETPLINSFDIILDQINLDIVKILKYNRI